MRIRPLTLTHLLALLPLALSLLAACVPIKEFKQVVAQSEQVGLRNRELERTHDSLSLLTKELQATCERLQRNLDRLTQDSLSRGSELTLARESLARLQRDYQELETLQRGLVEGNQRETSKLLGELQRMQQQLIEREDAVKALEQKLYQRRLELDKIAQDQGKTRKRLDSIERALAQRETDLLELRQAMARKDSLANALRKSVADALFGFEGKGLHVQQRNGRVYVSLDEKLMFRSGSYDVDPKGQEALKQLIPVLEQHPDINVLVEGHTDDVPMRGSGPIADNWDLSTKRATSIVRILIRGTKIAPKRVSAAGRAEFQPVEARKTPEARQKNRRTEIILTPQIDKLLQALGTE